MAGKKNGLSGGIELFCGVLIAVLASVMIFLNVRELKQKEQEYIAQEELLRQQIREEEDRTAELEERKKYVKTDQYIEEIAREKLGLINRNEILFKEKEDD